MKKFVAIFILIVSFAGGCIFGYNVIDQNKENNALRKNIRYYLDMSFLDTLEYKVLNPIYIYLENHLMGKYDKEGWHSLGGEIFYLKDIVVAPSFKVYNVEKYFEETNIIGWDISDGGLGSFGFDSDTEYTIARQEAMLNFTGKTKEELENGDTMGYVKLPTRIKNRDLRGLSIPYYNAYADIGKYEQDYDKPIERILAFNADHDPRPDHYDKSSQLPKEYSDYFIDKFKREGMPDVPLALTGYYQYDADGDKKDEGIMILQNTDKRISKSERGKKDYGLYTYAFYVDGERIQEIYGEKMLCHSNEAISLDHIDVTALSILTALGAFDLNGDGKLEFCMRVTEWESGYIAVYALNDEGEYEIVLTSPYGM